MEGELVSQFTTAGLVVYLIQWMKNSKLVPFIDKHSVALNRITSVVLAGASAVGVQFAFDTTNGVLTITGLTLTGILGGLWLWLNQFIIQQVAYDAILNTGKTVNVNPQSTTIINQPNVDPDTKVDPKPGGDE